MKDFEMYAGDSKTLQVTVTDALGTAPVDLAGAAVVWQLAEAVCADPLVSKSIGNGVTIVDAPAGRFDVALLPADTEGLRGAYYHEAEITNLGIVSTVLVGVAEIKPANIKPPP